jgi:hypothetical protein
MRVIAVLLRAGRSGLQLMPCRFLLAGLDLCGARCGAVVQV